MHLLQGKLQAGLHADHIRFSCGIHLHLFNIYDLIYNTFAGPQHQEAVPRRHQGRACQRPCPCAHAIRGLHESRADLRECEWVDMKCAHVVWFENTS